MLKGSAWIGNWFWGKAKPKITSREFANAQSSYRHKAAFPLIGLQVLPFASMIEQLRCEKNTCQNVETFCLKSRGLNSLLNLLFKEQRTESLSLSLIPLPATSNCPILAEQQEEND